MTDVNAQTIVTVAKEAAVANQSIRKTEDGREFILLPTGAIQWLTHRVEGASAIKGERSFHEGDSLAEYVKRFKDSSTIMRADINTGVVLVNLDYHAPGVASHVQHTAKWQLPQSEPFKVWNKSNKAWLDQEEMLEHLEENISEIILPEPTRILELINDFQMVKTTEFRSAKNRTNGDRNLQWMENGNVKGEIAMPKKITLEMPIYRGEEIVRFEAWFRYRVEDGELALQYEFYRIDPVMQAAFRQAVTRVADLVGLTPLYAAV